MAQRRDSATACDPADEAAIEAALLAGCSRADPGAFAQLVARYQDRVAGLAYRLQAVLGDLAEA